MNNTMKLLIIDDEADIRLSLTEILEEENYQVVAVESAASAEKAMQKGVDLVILDIKLGKENGIDLLRRFKQTRPHMPVIMISGHGTVALVSRAFKLGAYDFLEKSILDIK